jgi:hypothetical protein
MSTTFLADADRSPAVRVALDIYPPPEAGREAVRLIAIGSRQGISRLIHRLHNLGFAEAGAWSRLIPTANPDEFMSVLTWYVRLT